MEIFRNFPEKYEIFWTNFPPHITRWDGLPGSIRGFIYINVLQWLNTHCLLLSRYWARGPNRAEGFLSFQFFNSAGVREFAISCKVVNWFNAVCFSYRTKPFIAQNNFRIMKLLLQITMMTRKISNSLFKFFTFMIVLIKQV